MTLPLIPTIRAAARLSLSVVSLGAAAALPLSGVLTNVARAAGAVALAIDQATVLRLSRPAGTIILGNPLIADASVQDAETLILTGRSFGITNIIVLDPDGHEVLNTQLTVQSSVTAPHIVTMHRSTARTSYSCTPDCEKAPILGDDSESFSRIAGQIGERIGLSTSE